MRALDNHSGSEITVLSHNIPSEELRVDLRRASVDQRPWAFKRLAKEFIVKYTESGKILNQKRNLCTGSDVTILGANLGDPVEDKNSNGAIIKLSHNSHSIIFPGDAEKITVQGLEVEGTLDADVVMAPHHGAKTKGSNDEEWVKLTKPKNVIFSAGKYSRYGHPAASVVETYQKYGAFTKGSVPEHKITAGVSRDSFRTAHIRSPIYSTHDSGTLVVNMNEDPLYVRETKEFFAEKKAS